MDAWLHPGCGNTSNSMCFYKLDDQKNRSPYCRESCRIAKVRYYESCIIAKVRYYESCIIAKVRHYESCKIAKVRRCESCKIAKVRRCESCKIAKVRRCTLKVKVYLKSYLSYFANTVLQRWFIEVIRCVDGSKTRWLFNRNDELVKCYLTI